MSAVTNLYRQSYWAASDAKIDSLVYLHGNSLAMKALVQRDSNEKLRKSTKMQQAKEIS